MGESWQRRIDRALHLAEAIEASRPLLLVYSQLLGLQRDCYETIRGSADRLTGSLDRDLPALRAGAAPMLSALATAGPPPVADEVQRLLAGEPSAVDAALRAAWHAPSDHQFVAKAVLQPYAECLVAIGARPLDRDLPPGRFGCPFCGGSPQLSILQSVVEASDGGGRYLLCATCATTWPFGRVKCAYCGEEDEHRLGYYHAPLFDHLRVDVCESCRHYLKTVDRTRLGLAVPVVDEVAGASLDLWARDQGYEKIELNLVGL